MTPPQELAHTLYEQHRARRARGKRPVKLPTWDEITFEQRRTRIQRAISLQRQYYRIEAREVSMTL